MTWNRIIKFNFCAWNFFVTNIKIKVIVFQINEFRFRNIPFFAEFRCSQVHSMLRLDISKIRNKMVGVHQEYYLTITVLLVYALPRRQSMHRDVIIISSISLYRCVIIIFIFIIIPEQWCNYLISLKIYFGRYQDAA